VAPTAPPFPYASARLLQTDWAFAGIGDRGNPLAPVPVGGLTMDDVAITRSLTEDRSPDAAEEAEALVRGHPRWQQPWLPTES